MAEGSLSTHHNVMVTSVASNMVPINGGDIVLKDEGTGRRWSVQVDPFQISKVPITKAVYSLLGERSAPTVDDQDKPAIDVSWYEAISFCNFLSEMSGLEKCYSWDSGEEAGSGLEAKPTGQVTWGEVTWDRAANGYRLPTEAEWEFGCRAGSDEVRYGELGEIAWYRDNSGKRLHEVGLKRPNDWGLYDMIGNAWEWCWDLYDPEVYGPYRVFRGGGWNDLPYACRASCRRKSHPTFGIDDLGFRVVRSRP